MGADASESAAEAVSAAPALKASSAPAASRGNANAAVPDVWSLPLGLKWLEQDVRLDFCLSEPVVTRILCCSGEANAQMRSKPFFNLVREGIGALI